MDALCKTQNSLYSSIQRAMVNFRKSPKERLTQEYIEIRIETLDNDWKLIRKNHCKIIELADPVTLEELPYMKDDVYGNTEELYFDYKTLMKIKLNEIIKFDKPPLKNESGSSVKLPQIVIPKFSGNYQEWPTFRDLFISLIHRNEALDDVQKLQYLKGQVTDEADRLLRQYQITEANYAVCWDLLEKRFNNKKYLGGCIMNRLFSMRRLTTESGNGLKQLYDTTNDCLNAMTNLGVDISTWDVLIIHMLTFKLDPTTRREWELKVQNDPSVEFPTYAQFKEFLEGRYRALENLERKGSAHNDNNSSNRHQAKVHLATDDETVPCEFCSETHKLCYCKKFAKLSVDKRQEFVNKNKMCFNCLGGNHMIRQCGKKTTCRICKKRHHSLLHPKPNENVQGAKGQQDKTPPSNGGSKAGGSGDSPETENVTACLSTGQHLEQRQVLLATALVNAESRSGDFKVVRALLDQGSQASFVTEDAAQLLRLKRHPARGLISGLGSDKTVLSKSMVTILVQSRTDPNISLKIQAYVLKSITSYLPNRKVKPTDWLEIKDIPLADPQFNTPNKIDLLLGAEVYSQILREGVKRSPSQTLIAQNTSFGWIVSGLVMSSRKSDQIPSSITVMHTHVFEDDLLRKFWEIEEPSVSLEKMFTEEERRCEELFKATTRRDASGRYVVRLPFRETEPLCMGGSRDVALKRFKGLERKFKRDTDLKHKYTEVIKEYQQLNHMKPVEKEDKKKEVAVYLPHHAVVREDKTTTKVRVVFDASCKNNKGVSLNDTLMIGPTLQPELRHTILRWRVHPIGLVADIIKMYRQVRVAEEDQSFQRIVWRDHPGEEIKDYELLTVTFGTASAPYQAVRALEQVAYDEGDQYLLAKERVLDAFYMDDLLTGCQTVKEGVEVHQQMCELLKKGGFELQKWNSNDKYLLKMITEKENESKGQINQEDISKEEEEKDREIKLDETIKILGLTWELDHDDMKYTVKLPPSTTGPETKRSVISEIARLFDPLGWIAPVVILAKIFIQKLWLSGIGWDEEVPEELLREWKTYHSDLVQLSDCRIPRWLHTRNNDAVVELHGFSDASKMAYAAVVYTRVVSKEGEVHVSLLTAKTKVAPIKQRSIPRLELCGASLLTQLLGEMAAVLKIPKDHVHAWTDSTIVLAWLNKHPSHWKTFVANRVSDILSHLDACQWAHVSTKDNPADCASRGVQPADLAGNTLWFTGPNFLKESTIVYSKPKELKTDLEQSPVKAHVGAVETDSSDQWWSKYSLLRKLLKVVAYCRRFLHYKKDTPRPKHLKMVEIQDALTCCIKKCQSEEFGIEIGELQERNCVKFKDSKIKSLTPYLDSKGVLRVGGRLDGAQLNENTKHPIVMPHNSHLTHLLVADAHDKTLHGGPQLMMCYLRTAYWILGVKGLVRQYVRKCVVCAKCRAEVKNQFMGSLPSVRVTPARPFLNTGVDYAGPINIRMTKGRGHKSYKGYICLFVCMVTRAIHLEVVSDMTTQGFIAAFRRFVARRGHCAHIWSDNGTNFVGAAKELKELADIQQSIAENLEIGGTEWHFIPPHSPNFGGLWEAGVKSTKFHIKRVVGDSTLTFEEMITFLSQVEACLNSRPMMVVNTEDPGEPEPLTPGHFLIGEPLVAVPGTSYESNNVSTLTRWQMVQKMVQGFWRRWSQEYLTSLLHRYKWAYKTPEPNVGDLVLIKEDDLPPSRWMLGRVVDKHAGSDGITRVVTVKTKGSVVKRPTSKLCILPVND